MTRAGPPSFNERESNQVLSVLLQSSRGNNNARLNQKHLTANFSLEIPRRTKLSKTLFECHKQRNFC